MVVGPNARIRRFHRGGNALPRPSSASSCGSRMESTCFGDVRRPHAGELSGFQIVRPEFTYVLASFYQNETTLGHGR
jgi:hypothetical protein